MTEPVAVGPGRLAALGRLLPRGSATIGLWLGVSGILALLFQRVAGQAIGTDRYSGLAALWALGFLLGPGCFISVEQEVARAVASRRALGLGGGPVVRRAAVLAGLFVSVVVVVVLALSPVLVPQAFDDDWLLMVGLCAMLLGYALEHLSRGTLAGNERFGPYGLLLGGEAMARFLGCVVLAGLGVATAGPYGVVLGLAPFAGVAVALWRQRGLLEPGPPASWRELSRALGWLLGASLLAQVLVNAPPIVVKLLEPADSDLAGKMLQSLVIARVPLFFFQAVQAALVPDLAALAAARDRIRFRAGVGRLLVVLGALTVVSTALMLAIGPDVVGIAFGDEFALSGRDLGLLALASSIYLFALALAQVLVAIARPARAAAGWAAGVAALGVTIALGSDVLLRTELGLLAGALVSTAVMALLMTRPVHSVFAEPAPGGVLLEAGTLRVPEPGEETD